MPMISRCCFSKNLRAGAIACGIWTLVWCFYLLGTSGSLLALDIDTEKSVGELQSPNDQKAVGVSAVLWTTLCVSLLTFLSAIALIVAVLKDTRRLMIPWMLMVAISLTFDAISVISGIVEEEGALQSDNIIFILIWIITSLVNIYCELCVISHYQELKFGRGTRQDYLGTVRTMAPYSPVERTFITHVDQESDVDVEWIGGHDVEVNASSPMIVNGCHAISSSQNGSLNISIVNPTTKPSTSLQSEQHTGDAEALEVLMSNGDTFHLDPHSPGDTLHIDPQSSGDTIHIDPQSPRDTLHNDPQSPGDALHIDPQSPGDTLHIDPQSPGDTIHIDPQSPGDTIHIDPQSPGDTLHIDPQSPGDTIHIDPQSPGDTLHIDPQSPGDKLHIGPQSPGDTLHIDPQSSGDMLHVDPQSAGDTLHINPQSPGDMLHLDPQSAVTEVVA